MLDDFINMTHGQLFVKYWWLWLMILVGGAIFYWFCAPDSKKTLKEDPDMAKFEAVIKAELDPQQPVVEIMAVIGAMLQNNPRNEGAILLGVYEQIGAALDRMTRNGGRTDAK